MIWIPVASTHWGPHYLPTHHLKETIKGLCRVLNESPVDNMEIACLPYKDFSKLYVVNCFESLYLRDETLDTDISKHDFANVDNTQVPPWFGYIVLHSEHANAMGDKNYPICYPVMNRVGYTHEWAGYFQLGNDKMYANPTEFWRVEPTSKSVVLDQMVDAISQVTYGVPRSAAILTGHCVQCKKQVVFEYGSWDKITQDEYRISGFCPSCQRETFGG